MTISANLELLSDEIRSSMDRRSGEREPDRPARRQMGMRRTKSIDLIAVVTLAFAPISVIWVGSAAADCPGPTVEFTPHDVVRGGEVTVTGEAMGDNCYDTGPPPKGEGDLGHPLTGIEIVITQGKSEWILATVDANDKYAFTTQVRIPADASPGEATLMARVPGHLPGVWNPDPSLDISPAPAIQAPPVTEDGPGGDETSNGSPSEGSPTTGPSDAGPTDASSSGLTVRLLAGSIAGATVGLVAAVALARRRRSAQHG